MTNTCREDENAIDLKKGRICSGDEPAVLSAEEFSSRYRAWIDEMNRDVEKNGLWYEGLPSR